MRGYVAASGRGSGSGSPMWVTHVRPEREQTNGGHMRRGLIPLNMHAAIEPIAAIVLIASSWIFGFTGNNTAKVVTIVIGVIMLVAGSMTDWRLALMRVIPL